MALPVTFANQTTSTGPQLDSNFAAVGALGVLPCTVSGTNTLALTLNANTPTISAYANYLRFSGIAANTNTAAATAAVGGLAALNIYKDTPAGAAALAAGDIVQHCAFTLIYDSALNSGAGGFHLVSTPVSLARTGGTISGNLNVTGTISGSIGSLTGALAIGGTFSGASATVTGAVTGSSIYGSIGSLTGALAIAGAFSGASATVTGAVTGSSIYGSLGSIAGAFSVGGSLGAASIGTGVLQVGSSLSTLTRFSTRLQTLAYSVTPAQTAQDQVFTLTTAVLGDQVNVGYSVAQANASFTGYVPAAGSVAVRLTNAGAASLAAFTLVARVSLIGATG